MEINNVLKSCINRVIQKYFQMRKKVSQLNIITNDLLKKSFVLYKYKVLKKIILDNSAIRIVSMQV